MIDLLRFDPSSFSFSLSLSLFSPSSQIHSRSLWSQISVDLPRNERAACFPQPDKKKESRRKNRIVSIEFSIINTATTKHVCLSVCQSCMEPFHHRQQRVKVIFMPCFDAKKKSCKVHPPFVRPDISRLLNIKNRRSVYFMHFKRVDRSRLFVKQPVGL